MDGEGAEAGEGPVAVVVAEVFAPELEEPQAAGKCVGGGFATGGTGDWLGRVAGPDGRGAPQICSGLSGGGGEMLGFRRRDDTALGIVRCPL